METNTANQASNKSTGSNEEMKISVGREELKQTVCLLACSLGESEVNKKDEAILDAIHRLNRIITQGDKMIQFASPSQPGPSPQESDGPKPETDVPTDSPMSDMTADELSGQLQNPARPGVTMVTKNGEIMEEMLLECYNGSDDTDLEDYYGVQPESRESLTAQQSKLSHSINLPPTMSNGIGLTRGMVSGIMHPLKMSSLSRRKHERQTFTCYKCKERIVCVTNFEKHMMEAHNIGKPWECRFCPGRRFHRLILLEHHYNTMHKNNGEGRRKYTQRQFICDVCHEVVTYVSKFEAHMLEKHGVRKPWRCDQCVNYAAATYHLYMWHVQQYHPNITKHHLEISTVVNNTVNINSTGPQSLVAAAPVLVPQRPTLPATLPANQPRSVESEVKNTEEAVMKSADSVSGSASSEAVSGEERGSEVKDAKVVLAEPMLLAASVAQPQVPQDEEKNDGEEDEEEDEEDEGEGELMIAEDKEMDFADPERPDDEMPMMKTEATETSMPQSQSLDKIELNECSPQNLVVKREPNWEDEASEDSGCQGEENNPGDGANGNHGAPRRSSVELEMEDSQDENRMAFMPNYPRKYTIRRFICELCGVEIRHTAKYERHMFEMHNVTMPYKCNKCSGKRFMRLIQLQVHEDKMHSHKPVETRRKWTQRQFQCPICREKITYVAKYQQHMILEHGVMRMFDCRVCGHAMGHYHQYQDHMRTYHPNASVRHYSETESLTNSGSATGQNSDDGT